MAFFFYIQRQCFSPRPLVLLWSASLIVFDYGYQASVHILHDCGFRYYLSESRSVSDQPGPAEPSRGRPSGSSIRVAWGEINRKQTFGSSWYQEKPRSAVRTGVGSDRCRELLRREALVRTQAHHVLEHGCSGRQIGRVQELRVEEIVSCWCSIDDGAALEYASVILRIIHADERTGVIHDGTVRTAVLEVAEEVVHTAIGAEVLYRDGIGPAGQREGDALAGSDCHPVIAGVSGAITNIAREQEAFRIRPAHIRRRCRRR